MALSFVSKIATSLYQYFLEDEEDSSANSWDVQHIVDGFIEKKGTLTYLDNKTGVIDSVHTFSAKIISRDSELRAGDSVSYHCLCKNDGDLVIQSVSKSENEFYSEDEEEGLEENVKVRQVDYREGRLLKFSEDNISVDLDSIHTPFLPIQGDWIQIIMREDKPYALIPARSKCDKGVVTIFKDNVGAINNAYYFTMDVCVTGYIPAVHDSVSFEAIESKQGIYNWRALSVAPLFSPGEPPAANEAELFPNSDVAHNIIISGGTDFGEVELNLKSPKKLQLTLLNHGAQNEVLEDAKFLRDGIVRAEGIEKMTVIEPSGKIRMSFTCEPKYSGQCTETFIFYFRGFKIQRSFTVLVSESRDIRDRIRPGKFEPASVAPLFVEKNNSRLYGKRITTKKHFGKKTSYRVPEKIMNVFEGPVATPKELIETFTEFYPCLKGDLRPSDYCLKMHTLIFLEQVQEQMDLQKYFLTDAFFLRRGDLLWLEVKGLVEQRPSLLVGDKVIVKQPWLEENKTDHVGFIHEIRASSVGVSFDPTFHNGYDCTACDVHFEVGMGQYSSMHDAVDLAFRKLGSSYLFPSAVPKNDKLSLPSEIKWFNLDLNEQQRAAVINVLEGLCRPLPHIIFGPPGTGKTVTVVESVLQIWRTRNDSRILVCGPSNSAADLLAQNLIKGGGMKPGQLVRLMAFNRLQENIPDDLLPFSVSLAEENESQLARNRIVVGTCVSVASLQQCHLPHGHFTHVFIDEAGYATEPQTLIPLSFLDCHTGQAVLAGDPQQLGPVVFSKVAQALGLGESLLVRLMKRFPYPRDPKGYPDTLGYDPRMVTRLIINYRSVPEILALPNQLFYNGELKPTVSATDGREGEIISAFDASLPHSIREEPVTILFHGIRGQEYQEDDSPSWLNPQELHETLRYLNILYDAGVTADEIAVIAPYRKQVAKIRQMLNFLNCDVPKIGSVEEMQGQERQVIILSCVRSSFHVAERDWRLGLGFISNPRRVNVSLTRARALLIILGNPHLLVADPYWRSVLKYCVECQAYIGCDLPESLNSQLP